MFGNDQNHVRGSEIACSFLLVIDTIALRMMLGKARGEANATASRLALLIWMRWPAIGLCLVAAAAIVGEWGNGNPPALQDILGIGVRELSKQLCG